MHLMILFNNALAIPRSSLRTGVKRKTCTAKTFHPRYRQPSLNQVRPRPPSADKEGELMCVTSKPLSAGGLIQAHGDHKSWHESDSTHGRNSCTYPYRINKPPRRGRRQGSDPGPAIITFHHQRLPSTHSMLYLPILHHAPV